MKSGKFEKVGKIKNVIDGDDTWTIEMEGSGFGLSKTEFGDFEPKVGQEVEMRCVQGSKIVGLKIDGKVLFDKTDAEVKEEHRKWCEEKDKKDRIQFLANKEKLDALYDSLPDPFKKRLDKFRTNNPDFRWKFEEYEMKCIETALHIAEATKTVNAFELFMQGDFEHQKKVCPKMDDGLTGNMFHIAARLAYLYLANRHDDIVKLHGALAPLVGSEEYGCVPRGTKVEDDDEDA